MPGTRMVNASTGKGRVVLVTGGASGIGEAASIACAREGGLVAICDIAAQADRAKNVIAQIEKEGGKAIWLPLDVTEESEWEAVVNKIEQTWGPLDAMIQSAGVPERKYTEVANFPLEEKSLESFQIVMKINLEGVFLGHKYGIRSMKKRTATESASIVNISSINGLVGGPYMFAYAASKGGVRLLTKSAALYTAEKKYNIRVNSVHPGYIITPMSFINANPDDRHQLYAEWTPFGRHGVPMDIGNACLFLCTEESSFMTGSEVVVDGGVVAK